MNMQYSYETIGSSSYLVAKFPGGQGIINYQLQMLANNEIKNIIRASKRQQNDDVLVSYNITSLLPLSELDSKHKITESGMIHLIEGAINAMNDAAEYQLVGSGIVFDERYIFVKASTYEPSFIYLPCHTEDAGIEPLKALLLSMIISSKVEMTNDNFVQILLETLNRPALSMADLKEVCEKFKDGAGNAKKRATVEKGPERTKQPVATAAPQPAPVRPEPVRPEAVPAPEKRSVTSIPERQPVAEPKNEKTSEKKKKGGQKNSKKVLFLALQAIFIAIVIALLACGVLNNEAGQLDPTYLFGVILTVGATDFIVYRELFKNSKQAKGQEQKKSAEKKKPAAKSAAAKVAVPGKEMPSVPGSEMKRTAQPDPVQSVQQEPVQPEPVKVSAPVYVPVPPAVPAYNAPISDFEPEDTVVMDDSSAQGAYLEFYENGLATRISINKEYVVVGKLRSQCDFVINNNKISKVHAEFITRDGQYFVKDYNSTNGTYINGSTQRIQSNTEHPIYNGDRITLANVELTFKC